MVQHQSALVPRVRRLTGTSAPDTRKPRRQGKLRAVAKLLILSAGVATLSVRVVGAPSKPGRPSGPVENVRSSATLLATSRQLPDTAAQNAEMAALANREHELGVELDSAAALSTAGIDGTSESMRVLELSQELRHVRAKQAFLEERFLAAWPKPEAR
jgi:hypothetical protein